MAGLNRRGLHPLLATVLLIAITITGAAFTYTVFFSHAGATGKHATVDIARVNLTKSDVGCLFTITIKNTGNVEITSATVGLQRNDGGTYSWNLGGLSPGQERGTSQWVDAGQFTLGRSYTVWIDYDTADGGRGSTSTTVMCTR